MDNDKKNTNAELFSITRAVKYLLSVHVLYACRLFKLDTFLIGICLIDIYK